MSSFEPPISFLDQASMNRIEDKNSLDQYLKGNNGSDDFSDKVRFHVNPELKKVLRKLIKKLDQVDQSIIYQRYWDDKKTTEIARNLKLSKAQVDQRLVEILAQFRESILKHIHGVREDERQDTCIG